MKFFGLSTQQRVPDAEVVKQVEYALRLIAEKQDSQRYKEVNK